MTRDQRYRLVFWPLAFGACLLPLVWLAYMAGTNALGANPIEAINRFLGDWALRFLIGSLAVTPLTRLLHMPILMRFRRMIGLYAFFYLCLHVSSYIILDQFFAGDAIWADILKRPYITVGTAALLMLIPLAATSTAGMVKRLGAKAWKRLHRLVYAAACLGCLHYFWMVKVDVFSPLIYSAVLAVLLGWRLHTRVLQPALARKPAARAAAGRARSTG